MVTLNVMCVFRGMIKHFMEVNNGAESYSNAKSQKLKNKIHDDSFNSDNCLSSECTYK